MRIPTYVIAEVAAGEPGVELRQGLLEGRRQRGKCGTIDTAAVRRYLTRMTTTVSSKGQIVLPAAIRQQDGIKPGQQFEVERIDQGEYLLKRTTRRRNQGLVKLLLACPVKDWFIPMDRTATTDDIPAPKLG